MPIRRIVDQFASQDWFSIWLELIVLVLGILLAFQVDRWYESYRLGIEEAEHLQSLLVDFAGTQQSIDETIERHEKAIDAALQLLNFKRGETIDLDKEEFYAVFSHVQYVRIANYQRSTYDYLIASGAISIIQDEKIRSGLNEIYSMVDGSIDDMRDDLQSYWRAALEPYVRENLDHIALMKAVHPDDSYQSLPDTFPSDHFHAVLGTGEFNGIVSDKWHLSRDLVGAYGRLSERIDGVSERVRKVLAGSE